MTRFKRHLAFGTLAGALLLAGGARAEVVLEAEGRERPAAQAPDVGGQPIVPSGRLRLSCTQYGVKIADQEVRNVAVSPLSALGWLSFEGPGGRGRSVLLPFGDGGTACLLAAEPVALKQAAAAFQAAIAHDRPVSWNSTLARAMGQVVPSRTFVDVRGRTCREFTQILHVHGRADRVTGTACEHDQGGWRWAP